MKNAWATCAIVLLVACTGSIGDPGSSDRAPNPDDPNDPNDPNAAETPPAVIPLRCEEGDDRPGVPRAWRLSAAQFAATMERFVTGRRGGDRPRLELPPVFSELDPSARFSTRAASYTMTDLELRQALEAASAVARATIAHATEEARVCRGEAWDACVRTELSTRAAIAFGRPLNESELDRFVALARGARETLGDDDALALAYEAILANPETLFRLEVGRGRIEGSAVRLDGFEIARALAYSLTDAPPDTALWAAAESGVLDTDDGVATQVDRLLGDLSKHATTKRFLLEYFGYDAAPGIFQESEENPDHRPGELVDDTARFITLVLEEAGDARFLETLLAADFAIARESTQSSYGLSGLGRDPTRVTLPEERLGILLQPAWLASFARTGETDPIHRGRFVSESLLCRPIPPIPIELDPVLPDVPGATMRERLEEHTKDPCAGCHRLMDPIGLSMEAFDHFGRFRTEELGEPVDVSGDLEDAGSQSGTLSGGRDLVERLAASEVVRACFVRHAFRFWLGRDEREGDGCALTDAYGAYETDGSYRDLVRELFLSRAFLWREQTE